MDQLPSEQGVAQAIPNPLVSGPLSSLFDNTAMGEVFVTSPQMPNALLQSMATPSLFAEVDNVFPTFMVTGVADDDHPQQGNGSDDINRSSQIRSVLHGLITTILGVWEVRRSKVHLHWRTYAEMHTSNGYTVAARR